ncbi:carcinoembryonic antigen-related cell adhesion molecule 19 isoform X3 [Camelus ferus]|uniref:Carcinoembryonic antigen-related cell adhesion molecule 19 isoform X3 n=2 Tax=Camelus TaxID=9836 RepID=A0A8B8THN4_CAMFR|nr:carcinoembryonic antigen-related cell adhesion molecule 19 isoform X3 [Camelus ferus]
MEIPAGAQQDFSKSLLLSVSILALWVPPGSWAALRIQKIPEQPQTNQDLLLSVQGIPDTFQDFNWYLGEETYGGTMLFTYIPGLLKPQRDGSAMKQRDIIGFPNGSMLLCHAQPTDSGTYQVAVTINPAWTMRAKTEVQVAEKPKELPITNLPVSAGIVAAIIIGSLAIGSLCVGSIAYLLVTRGWRAQSHRMTATEKPEVGSSHHAGDNNIYEAMPTPVLLVSPLSDTRPTNATMLPPLPQLPPLEPESHHYQDLLNPDPAPYCQLVPTPEGVPG